MSNPEDNRLLHTVEKNALEEVRICLTTYKGRDYLDLRVFYGADDREMRPTKKGLTRNLDLVPELETVLQKLRACGRRVRHEGHEY